MKPRSPRNSGVIVNPKKGTLIRYHARYQLAPAVTKNAPDRNLKTSFQLSLIANAIRPNERYQAGSPGGVKSTCYCAQDEIPTLLVLPAHRVVWNVGMA